MKNESNSSQGFSLEDLVKLNGAAMTAMDEVPYQPILYAIPKEWRESWRMLLEQAVRFQPTLYGMITPLATQEQLQKQETELKVELRMTKKEVLNRMAEMKQQDGSSREKFFSELSKLHSDNLRELREEYGRQAKKAKGFLWIIPLASAVLSALVCGVFLLLAV